MNVNKKVLFHNIVVLLLMFGLKYVPPFGQVTEFGMAILGIFLGIIYGWLTLGFLMPSLCAIFALGFSGAYDSLEACFAATLGSDIVAMMIGCLFIMALMQVLNLTDVIVGFLLNLKFAQKNMTVFFAIFFIASWVVAVFSGFALSVPLFATIYASMAEKANIKPFSRVNSFVLSGLALTGMIANMSFPFKAVSVTMMNLFNTYTGLTLSFLDYILYVTSYQIVIFVLYTLIGRFILRIDFSIFTAAKIEKVKANSRQKAGLFCMLLMLVGFVLTSSHIYLFNYLGLGGVGLGLVLIMVIIQVDGKPLLNMKEVAGKFDWSMLFMMAFFMEFIGYIGSADVGLTATVKVWLAPILSVLPPMILIIVSIVGTVLVSNVLNNLPVAIIFISIMDVIAQSVEGINAPAAIIAVVIASYLAFATPAANPGTALTFGYKNLVKTSVHVKTAVITSSLLGVFTAFVYYPFLCWVF